MSALPLSPEAWGPEAGEAHGPDPLDARRAAPTPPRALRVARRPGAPLAVRRFLSGLAAILLAFALGYGLGLAWRGLQGRTGDDPPAPAASVAGGGALPPA